MDCVLVSGPLTDTQTETSATKLKGVVVSNSHAADDCVVVIRSVNVSGKVIWQGVVLAGDTVVWNPHFAVGCAGVYVGLTGGTGAVMIYYN
jgi:hypothetical protein